MKTLILLLVLIPSLASAQTAQNRNGWVISLKAAIQTLKDGTPIGKPVPTRRTFGATVPIGTPCIRCTVYLNPERATLLDISEAALSEVADRYGVLQVCGAPSAVTQEIPDWLNELIETCGSTVTATAVWPSVILASRNDPQAQAVATGWACACRGAGTCNWTPPLPGGGFGAAVSLPKNLTSPPGLWSGAGCVLKTCVELYGFESMPLECKN